MITIPRVLSEDLTEYNNELLRNEGRFLNRLHALPRTLEEWNRRREEIKAKIWELSGVTYDPSVALDFQCVKTVRFDGYTVRSVRYQTRPGIYATASLYVPDGDGPFPAVLNLHGHSREGRRLCYIQARGHSFAKNGYVCLSPDTWGMGERCSIQNEFEYHGSTLGGALILLGEAFLGALLVDNMRSVDLLSSLPFVDKDRLGVTGESGGGNQTMWVGAMDERLKAVMPVVSVGSFESYIMRSNCYCEVLPGAFQYFEEDSVLALVAPRALRMMNALQDSNPTFYVTEMMRNYRRAKDVFALYGHEQDISFAPFDTDHGYKPEMRETMLGFFDYYLKGIGNGNARRELPYETLAEFDELAVYAPGTRPAGTGTISEYLTSRFAKTRSKELKLGTLGEEQSEIRRIFNCGDSNVSSITFLGTAGKSDTSFIRRNMPAFGARRKYFEGVYSIGEEGAAFSRWLIRNSKGIAVPCLVRDSAEPGAVTYILASGDGKDDLSKSAYLEKLLQEKSARIIIIDLFGTGENYCREIEPSLPPFHTVARALLWMGRTLLGEWINCYLDVSSFSRTQFGSGKVVFFGKGEAGVAAMAAAVLGRSQEASSEFAGENVPESFAWYEGEVNPAKWRTLAEMVPYFAEWGDIRRIKDDLSL